MNKEKLIEEMKEYAKENGFELNPNEKVIEFVINGLLKNEETLGKRFCPCRVQKNEDTICPCKWHKDEIKENGKCHCGLFVKKSDKR